jgi:hypothetical protein
VLHCAAVGSRFAVVCEPGALLHYFLLPRVVSPSVHVSTQFCAEYCVIVYPPHSGLGKLEFNVQVLTTGHWPYYKNFDTIVLPAIMQRCTQVRSNACLIVLWCA